jgi:uncharacterized protein YciI
MTDAERSAFDAHAAWLRTLLADGVLIAAGPVPGPGQYRDRDLRGTR